MGIEEVEKYLMARAKGSIEAGDSSMAKSWLLTCSVLFPRSFSLQVRPDTLPHQSDTRL